MTELELRVGPGIRVWLAPDWADELRPLGLEQPGGLERFREGATPVPGGRARGWRVELASGRLVHLREMAHGGWLRGLTGRRFLGTGRATRSLGAATRLAEAGVRVPAPVAVHATRKGPFQLLSVAYAFLDDSVACGALLQRDRNPERVHRLAVGAAEAIRAFHDAGGRHPDLHLGNLLCLSPDDDPEVWIVDLDGVRVGRRPSTAMRHQELRRLQRSLGRYALPASTVDRWWASLSAAYAEGRTGTTADDPPHDAGAKCPDADREAASAPHSSNGSAPSPEP